MPRKLKTYVTTSGFFDLAVAAPSMKAALEIWGSTSNLFQKGFANETSDPEIVKATLGHPGIVLRRPVGSKGLFKENAELPELSVLQNAIKRNRPAEPPKKKAVKSKAKATKPAKPDVAATRKAARLYNLAEKRRERDDPREAAQRAKERDRRDQAVEKAQAALDEARSRHDARVAEIEKQREALDRKARLEGERWDEEEDKLKAALRRARDD